LAALAACAAMSAAGLVALPSTPAAAAGVAVTLTVTDLSGAPAECGATLDADLGDGNYFWDYEDCDSGGIVRFEDVAAGTYSVEVTSGQIGLVGGLYAASASPRLVNPVTDPTPTFQVGGAAVNLGTVALVRGAVVKASAPNTGVTGEFQLLPWELADQNPGPYGWYWSAFGELTAWPGDYAVRFDAADPGWSNGFLAGPVGAANVVSPYWDGAAKYTLPAGTTTFVVTTPAAGRVKLAPTGPVAGEDLQSDVGANQSGQFVSGAWLNPVFDATGLLPGSYVASVNRQSSHSVLAGGFYAGDGQPVAWTLPGAASFAVTAGQTTTIKPALSKCASVSGQIVGAPAGAFHRILVYPYDDQWTGRGVELRAGADATFKIEGLWPGKWTVRDTAVLPTGGSQAWFYNPVTNNGADPGADVLEITSCRDYTNVSIAAGAPGTLTAPVPTISGTAKVGSVLTASAGAWGPAGVELAYQWLRDGTAIAGATARTYTLVAADLGKPISVRVTGSLAGYAAVSKTSAQTGAVTGGYAPVMSAFTLSPDMTGDGLGEVLAVHSSGQLRLFPGTASGFSPSYTAPGPTGLAGSRIYGPGDWSNDKRADLAVIDSRGDLWLHQGDGRGKLSAGRVKLGNGWSTFMAVPAGDLTGDGQPDLLGVDLQTGLLYLYKWRAADNRFLSRVRVGNGWLGWQLHAAGDLNGDGRGDILGIDSKGDLYCYPGKGDGTFYSKKKCGNGWGTYQLVAGSDLTGDRYADIVGRDNATGTVYFYKGMGQGRFATRKQITTGW
jgi:hypothetical protein